MISTVVVGIPYPISFPRAAHRGVPRHRLIRPHDDWRIWVETHIAITQGGSPAHHSEPTAQLSLGRCPILWDVWQIQVSGKSRMSKRRDGTISQ